MTIQYLHLPPDSKLPELNLGSFNAVLVSEYSVDPKWRVLVCKWLVNSGCLYFMSWGKQCSLWHDSVDWVNIDMFSDGEIPENKFIMTTWHEKEQLKEVFWKAKNCAFHPTVELNNTLILHISEKSRENELLSEFNKT